MCPPMPAILLVLPVHHRHRVPADQRLDPPLQLAIAGIGQLPHASESCSRTASSARSAARCPPRAPAASAPSAAPRPAPAPRPPPRRQTPRSTRPLLQKSLSGLALPLLCSSIGITRLSELGLAVECAGRHRPLSSITLVQRTVTPAGTLFYGDSQPGTSASFSKTRSPSCLARRTSSSAPFDAPGSRSTASQRFKSCRAIG